MKIDVMFARFPYMNAECPDVTDWLLETVLKAKRDPRIGRVLSQRYDDTPITMTRNKAVADARREGVDFLLMIDSDMRPDCEPDGKPFWDTSLDFALANPPCIVAAPYCGPPPHENVYVFQFSGRMNETRNPSWALEQYTREEAAVRSGIERVAALPTGLMLIDMRALDRLRPSPDRGHFYYEWSDHTCSQKASTEDVTFTRDVCLAGVDIYCNWDAWAGHWKRHLVRKPRPLTVDAVRAQFADALRANISTTEKLLFVAGDRPFPRRPPQAVSCAADRAPAAAPEEVAR
jgi:hypothetical protein